jgi:2-C-methyl-D-erythritol 4-phosphate cytidylyltransferase
MHLLIPAAGVGRRMAAGRNKLLIPLLGRSILAWTLEAAVEATSIEWIGLICQPIDRLEIEQMVNTLGGDHHNSLAVSPKPIVFIQGGDTRQASVYNGLQALPAEASHVLIHDGARCLVTPALLDRCAEAALTTQGFIAAVPVKDTIKQVDAERIITHTPNREQLWAAQTPQGFEVTLLKQCHHTGQQQNWQVTDDAALLEKCNVPVSIVEGEETNLKVTTPVDLAIAEFILQQRGIP